MIIANTISRLVTKSRKRIRASSKRPFREARREPLVTKRLLLKVNPR